MKLSDIKSLFAGVMSIKEFKSNIFDDMKEYLSSSHVKGKAMPVFLIEDIDLSIGENELRILCEAFLNDELNASEINYIADALLLSDRVLFDNENLSDRVGYLTDPEINGPIDKDVIRNILRSQ